MTERKSRTRPNGGAGWTEEQRLRKLDQLRARGLRFGSRLTDAELEFWSRHYDLEIP